MVLPRRELPLITRRRSDLLLDRTMRASTAYLVELRFSKEFWLIWALPDVQKDTVQATVVPESASSRHEHGKYLGAKTTAQHSPV